jgi:hypothetical protein
MWLVVSLELRQEAEARNQVQLPQRIVSEATVHPLHYNNRIKKRKTKNNKTSHHQ